MLLPSRKAKSHKEEPYAAVIYPYNISSVAGDGKSHFESIYGIENWRNECLHNLLSKFEVAFVGNDEPVTAHNSSAIHVQHHADSEGRLS